MQVENHDIDGERVMGQQRRPAGFCDDDRHSEGLVSETSDKAVEHESVVIDDADADGWSRGSRNDYIAHVYLLVLLLYVLA
jgi:hypothetical protein